MLAVSNEIHFQSFLKNTPKGKIQRVLRGQKEDKNQSTSLYIVRKCNVVLSSNRLFRRKLEVALFCLMPPLVRIAWSFMKLEVEHQHW